MKTLYCFIIISADKAIDVIYGTGIENMAMLIHVNEMTVLSDSVCKHCWGVGRQLAHGLLVNNDIINN